MVDVGRLSFQLDYQGFRRDVQRMRFELDKLKRDARDVQQSMGGIGIGAAGARGAGRIGTPGAGALGGGGGFVGGVAAGRVGGGFGLGPLAGLASAGTAAAGLRALVRSAADLELQLAQVRAVTGATADQMGMLEQAARDAGASTQFTAGQAAGGLLELARAGLRVDQAMQALRPSLDLATAGMLSLSEAADLVTNVGAQFQLPAREIRRIGDSLVAVANNSNTTVAQLGQGLKDVGVVASEFGLSLEDTVGAMGALANAGLKGSDASIKLRQAFLQLADPSAGARAELERLGLSLDDVDIQAQGLERVLRNLSGAGLDIRGAAQLVGVRNASALTVLARNGGAGFAAQRDAAQAGVGASANVAAEIAGTTTGKIKQMASAIQELGLVIDETFGVSSGVADGAEKIAGFARLISDAANRLPAWAVTAIRATVTGGIGLANTLTRPAAPPAGPRLNPLVQAEIDYEARLRQEGYSAPGFDRREFFRTLSNFRRTSSGQAIWNPDDFTGLFPEVSEMLRQRSGQMLTTSELSSILGNSFGPRLPNNTVAPGMMNSRERQEADVQGLFRDMGNQGFYGPEFNAQELARTSQAGERYVETREALREEAELLKLSRLEREAYNAVKVAGVAADGDLAESIRAQVAELQRLERIRSVSDGIGQGISQIGAAWLFAADSAEEATRRILESISQLAVQEFALQPLANAISGIAGNLLGGFGSTSNTGRQPDIPGRN